MYYKVDQHSSSSCKGTSGLLHIMGSNTIILNNNNNNLFYLHYYG